MLQFIKIKDDKISSVDSKGNPVKLKKNSVEVGTDTPKVGLKAEDLSTIEIGAADKTQIVLSLPSLDTPVRTTEARGFNKRVASCNGAEVIVVSMDLPFAMGRFCGTEGIENLSVASGFVAKKSGEKYGVLIGEGPLESLLTRATFIIKDGKIAYKGLVGGATEMPDIAKLDTFFGGSSCCGGRDYH